MWYSCRTMNEKIQNVVIALIAVCIVIVGITVYGQGEHLTTQGTKIDRLLELANTPQKQVITLDQDKNVYPVPTPTNNAVAPAQDRVSPPTSPVATTPSMNPQNGVTTNNDGGNDGGASIIHGDFAAWLPLDWESRTTGSGTWNVTNDKNHSVATISCPSPEVGYQAWDFTQSNRQYIHNGKTLFAGKWIGKPKRGSEDLGWLAMVWGGSPDRTVWGGSGCQIMFKVSSPPTPNELDRIETIYQMIR